MPRIGLGVWQNKGESCLTACVAAIEHGYRHIDSAYAYRNETEVGQAVKQFKREDIFVTSKVTSRYHGYDATAKVVNESLKNFGFDYIDLYLLHDPLAGKEKRLESYRALVDLQKQEKLRSIGVSNYNIHHLEEIKKAGLPTPSVNQLELHPYCQQRSIAEYCNKEGIVVQAYSPLVRGNVGEDAIQEIAAAKDVTPFQVLVRWSLQKGFVPLPKSERPERITSNADVYNFELSAEEMARIDALDKGNAGAVTWNPVASP